MAGAEFRRYSISQQPWHALRCTIISMENELTIKSFAWFGWDNTTYCRGIKGLTSERRYPGSSAISIRNSSYSKVRDLNWKPRDEKKRYYYRTALGIYDQPLLSEEYTGDA